MTLGCMLAKMLQELIYLMTLRICSTEIILFFLFIFYFLKLSIYLVYQTFKFLYHLPPVWS
jgi:hypothetical protein